MGFGSSVQQELDAILARPDLRGPADKASKRGRFEVCWRIGGKPTEVRHALRFDRRADAEEFANGLVDSPVPAWDVRIWIGSQVLCGWRRRIAGGIGGP